MRRWLWKLKMKCMMKRYKTLIAPREGSIGLSIATPPLGSQPSNHDDESNLPADLSFQTLPDWFGVYCIYPGGKPLYTPDETYNLSEVVDSANIATEPSVTYRYIIAPARDSNCSRSIQSPLRGPISQYTSLLPVMLLFPFFPIVITCSIMSLFPSFPLSRASIVHGCKGNP